VSHPLQYQFGYDDNKFLNRPLSSNDVSNLVLNFVVFVVEAIAYVLP